MSDLIEKLILDRIGSEFDGECHLTDAEARQAAAEITSLHSQLEDARQADEWQDISTAPKDWTDILLVEEFGEVFVGYFSPEDDQWWDYQSCKVFPTNWRPLPAPPAIQSTDSKEVGG